MENYKQQNYINYDSNVTLYDLQNDFEYSVLKEKELSKDNILNFTKGLDITSEFYDVPACAIIKNAVPAGVSLGTNLKDAFEKAFDCNPVAAIGATAVFSQTVTKEIAQLAIQYQISAIASPAFDDKALETLKYHDEILLTEIKTPLNQYYNMVSKSITVTPFGLIEEKIVHKNFKADDFNIPSKTKPSQEQIEDMLFAYKIAKHLNNSCAVIAKDFKAVSITENCSCLPDAIEWALNTAADGTKEAVLGINESLTSNFAVNAAAQGRISAIICPNKDKINKLRIDLADKYSIALIEINING